MTTNISGRIPIIWLGVCALLASLLTPLSAHAFKDRTASIEASGDAAIFDVTATAQGVLKVCTKPARPLDRWRVTIAVPLQPASASLPSVNSAVGNGSTTAFSGCVTQTVAANVSYIVLVTWDRPLPGTFLPSSAKATVHFTSATETVDPPIKGIAPSCGPGASSCLLANIIQRSNRWPEPTAGSPPEGSFIGCEGTVLGELNPASDSDVFKVTVPANSDISLNLLGKSGTAWRMYAPDGTLISNWCSGMCNIKLPTAGGYTVQIWIGNNTTASYSLSAVKVGGP